jgi:hypothetical protein
MKPTMSATSPTEISAAFAELQRHHRAANLVADPAC